MAKFFINRPIVAMVIAILMVILGLVSMMSLPIAQFPNLAPPEIQVSTTYNGADALKTKSITKKVRKSKIELIGPKAIIKFRINEA